MQAVQASPPSWPQLDPAEQFLEIGKTATTFPGDPARARRQFQRHRAIHLHNLFEPAFHELVLAMAASTPFVQEVPGSTLPEVEAPQRVGRVLDIAFERPAMLRWLEDVTGCGPLRTFAGRLTQTRAQTGERRTWHDDLLESTERRLALVVNFSPAPYEGGAFQLRHKTGQPLFEHHYQQPAEAILFEVSPLLEHTVRPVRQGGPRRVYAGWALAR